MENEYGNNGLGICNKNYTIWLRDLFLEYIEDKAQLYTTDECDISYIRCGHIQNVYSTVDFSPTANGKLLKNVYKNSLYFTQMCKQ